MSSCAPPTGMPAVRAPKATIRSPIVPGLTRGSSRRSVARSSRPQPPPRRRFMPSALITGAAGFIGSHLSERLLGQGVPVVGVDRLSDYYDPALKAQNV